MGGVKRKERGILKEHKETFGVGGYMFSILTVVMVLPMCTYVKLIQLYVLYVLKVSFIICQLNLSKAVF